MMCTIYFIVINIFKFFKLEFRVDRYTYWSLFISKKCNLISLTRNCFSLTIIRLLVICSNIQFSLNSDVYIDLSQNNDQHQTLICKQNELLGFYFYSNIHIQNFEYFQDILDILVHCHNVNLLLKCLDMK